MKLVVIIPTLGRKALVGRLLGHLAQQSRTPDQVIVTAPDDNHVDAYETDVFPVSYVFGRTGLSAQRNAALDVLRDRFDVVTFFDDDFLPADNYLQLVVDAFEKNPDWAVITGHAVRDGSRDAGLSFEEGLAELRAAEASCPTEAEVTDTTGAYGCNMSVRWSSIGSLRFDERLALYGWQEDIDFTSQLRQQGRVVRVNTLIGVHLGLKAGRVSGVRFGYSQVINPIYLIRKGTVPPAFALELMFRNIAANLLKSIRPEPYVDRRGRLKGNLLAAYHLARGRIEPEYILKIR